ncbi:hypothetical protein, partial [Tolypothrix sp. VBCCA 56010]|uniref:hypothetical protein n=1 Tax=Tolypothrix sp. VBCCA 56010 TaxID=3137731 RepID=UPI003D7D6534
MRYNIISSRVGARHCRALTGVPHVTENCYISSLDDKSFKGDRSGELKDRSGELKDRSGELKDRSGELKDRSGEL